MRRSRKRPSSPTDGQPPSSALPNRLKKKRAILQPRAEDRGELAGTSSGIPSPVASSSQSQLVNVPIDESGPSKESGWKAAYGGARIAVEIAKESSDMLLPLKAVAGALSVLIKNYDQTTANADQIKGLEERIQSLSLGEVLASPVGNQDSGEKTRREALRKRLSRIVTELRPLSEQHGITKFLKNADDSNTLNGFVQELADAVTDYQTSIQQSIYENTKKIDNSTKGIGDDAKKINETTGRTDKTTKRIDEITRDINKTTRDINQTARDINKTTREINENTQNIIEAADLELLGKLDPVRNAGYQAGHHGTCLRGTRQSVLDWITRWSDDPQERHVFWLNGLAGTGKSTIAQTFSGMAAQNGTLGASFFCSRDYLDRKELKNIFPTISYQLACRYPSFRTEIIRVIKRDPSVAHNSLISQLKDLIVDPLSSTSISCLIVIDALDECVDDQPSSAILSVLGRYVKQLQSVKFFITGRPEPRIRSGFRLPLLEPLTQIFLLHEVEPSSVDGDIRLYLQEKLGAVAKRRSDLDLSDPWPSDEELAALTKKSSGLFIFASTLVRFIESEHHEPDKRLQLVVALPDNTVHEGQAGIDQLYTQVFAHAFSGVKEPGVFETLRRVLGAVILAFNPLSRAQIATILGLDAPLVATTLRHLHSVLLIPKEGSKEIRVIHKSFLDFLQDPTRCSDPKFFIDPAVHHGEVVLGCLDLMKKLETNPCNLPDFVMNRDVVGLPELLEDKLGRALRYACRYWALHTRSSLTTYNFAVRLIDSATEFFKNNAIPWTEVMSLENRLEDVIHSIHNLLNWIGMVNVPASNLRGSAQDFLRFTVYFFHPIQQSAPHIYHSALPLSPTSSSLRPMILQERTSVSDFYGCPDTWGAVMRTIKEPPSGSFTHVTTFGHWIAVARSLGPVTIYDSVTGALRQSLSPEGDIRKISGSPDGSMLFCVHDGTSITGWGVQTGGVIHTFVSEDWVQDIAICSKGCYLAWGLSGGSVKILEVANKSEVSTFGSGTRIAHLCWLEPGKQLVVTRWTLAEVWDVVAQRILRRFTMDGEICGVAYAQSLDRFAIATTSRFESTITVVDPHTGTSFIHKIPHKMSSLLFSPATNEFVCSIGTYGIGLFSVPTRSWRQFDHVSEITSVSTLLNGTVVANVGGSGVQLLSLDEGKPPPRQPTTSTFAVDTLDEDNIIAILPLDCHRDHIVLLESATMSNIQTIPPLPSENPSENIFKIHHSEILCASLKHRIVVHYLGGYYGWHLQLWRFGDKAPSWIDREPGRGLVGGISPSGSRLVAIDDSNDLSRVRVWDTENGTRVADIPIGWPYVTHPLEIGFECEDKLHSRHDTFLAPFTISGSSIIHHEKLPLAGLSQRHYDVDDSREWIVGSSKRVCWIPPGYIRSTETCCWAGNALIMAGLDGAVRKITFREPS